MVGFAPVMVGFVAAMVGFAAVMVGFVTVMGGFAAVIVGAVAAVAAASVIVTGFAAEDLARAPSFRASPVFFTAPGDQHGRMVGVPLVFLGMGA